MNEENKIRITHRDRVMRAWMNTTELVRDYQHYAKEMEDSPQMAAVFHDFAQTEAHHAARFQEMLHVLQQENA